MIRTSQLLFHNQIAKPILVRLSTATARVPSKAVSPLADAMCQLLKEHDQVHSNKRFLSGSPVKLVDNDSQKRTDAFASEDYFMALAILASKQSPDPATQVGCVVVNDEDKVMGTGFNAMPNGCSNDEYPWEKYAYVCHAGMNAIVNNVGSVRGCRLYTVLFPCNECAKLIVQTGIKKVICMLDRDDWSMVAAKILFRDSGIEFQQFKTQRQSVTIDFDPICYEGDVNFDKNDA